MKRYRVVVHTFEPPNLTDPVVTHQLYGDTPAQAHHIFQAHMKSDQFLRECVLKGCYARSVPCSNTMYLEDTRTRQRWPFLP